MWKVAMLPQSSRRYSHGPKSSSAGPRTSRRQCRSRSEARRGREGRAAAFLLRVAPRASDCYDGPGPLEGPMSSKRRRFDRRGVDPGLALIVGIAVGTALVLLLASWWR